MTTGNKRIILIHGWGSSTENLGKLKLALEKLGWKCYSPELPGFGAPTPVAVWGVTDYSKYVLAEGRKAFKNSPFFVFGHSFGGMVAIRMSSNNEDNKNVLGIILCGTNGISRPAFFKRTFFYTLAKLGKVFMIIPQFARLFRKVLYFFVGERDYIKTNGIMREVFKKVISDNLRPEVSRLKFPVLILWGEKDKATPITAGRYINKTVKQSKLVTYDEGDHFISYVIPDEIAKEIDVWYGGLDMTASNKLTIDK